MPAYTCQDTRRELTEHLQRVVNAYRLAPYQRVGRAAPAKSARAGRLDGDFGDWSSGMWAHQRLPSAVHARGSSARDRISNRSQAQAHTTHARELHG